MFLTLRCRRLRPGHRCRVGLNPLSTNPPHIKLKGTNLPGTQPPVATTHISDRAVATVRYTTWAGEPTKKAKLDQSPSMPYLRGESEKANARRGRNRKCSNAPLAGWLDPEGTWTWWFGFSSFSRCESRCRQEQQNVTDDSGPEGGQPHCRSTPARDWRRRRDRVRAING